MKTGVRLVRTALLLLFACCLCWGGLSSRTGTCQVVGDSAVCAGTTNTYTHTTDSSSTNFTYAWILSTNTAGAFVVGDTNLPYVEIFSESNGVYAVQLTLGTDGGDLIC